jgi:hypothetical protein
MRLTRGRLGKTPLSYVVTDALVNVNRVRINTLAMGAGLPTMLGEKGVVESGGPSVTGSPVDKSKTIGREPERVGNRAAV